MRGEELILLGKITKSHGFDGSLVILLEEGNSEKIKKLESVFVEVDGIPVPFFISWSSLSGRLFTVRFDGYGQKEKITEFIGCNVLARDSSRVTTLSPSLPVHITGYRVITTDGTLLGRIARILSFPMQVMLVIVGENENEILIPFNEEWIDSIDKKAKSIRMNLPDGIISLNE